MQIECRELKTMQEMEQIQVLEDKVWKMSPIPTHQTLTAVKNGGIMLGLFDGEKLVGFSYGFAGFKDGKSFLCSHLLGVDPDYRAHSLGVFLKEHQRKIALEKGYDLLKWTFDPLEARNAHLNLSRLHGVCDTYVENCYGEMDDKLNSGLPSDRFEVHWHIASPHVNEKHSLDISQAEDLNAYHMNDDGFPVYEAIEENTPTAETYSLIVPKDFQALKKADKALALEWRLKTRVQFQRLFAAKYIAVCCELTDEVSRYYFIKKEKLHLGGQ